MENLTTIAYTFFLAVILGIAVFNWVYKLEVEKVVRTEGFTIPQGVFRLLTINLFLPILVLLTLFFLMLVA